MTKRKRDGASSTVVVPTKKLMGSGWRLEIHHIDVEQGDATLVVARHYGAPDDNLRVRSMLIDGGKAHAAPTLETYLKEIAFLKRLDVLVITHYDEDHFWGAVELLNNKRNTDFFKNTVVFDQGEPGARTPYYVKYLESLEQIAASSRTVKTARNVDVSDQLKLPEGLQTRLDSRRKVDPVLYGEYSKAVQLLKSSSLQLSARLHGTDSLQRPTQDVNSFDVTDYDLTNDSEPKIPTYLGWKSPDWLLGQELLWWGVPPPTSPPSEFKWDQRPRVTCLAANEYVLQPDGKSRFVPEQNVSGNSTTSGKVIDAIDLLVQRTGDYAADDTRKNPKSLAVAVEFNNFKYYLGGDLTWVQEGGVDPKTKSKTPGVSQHGLMERLVPVSNNTDRVHAIKCSHHGSDMATTTEFLQRLKPVVAFISCGAHSSSKLPPLQPTLVRLHDAYTKATANRLMEHFYMTNIPTTVDVSGIPTARCVGVTVPTMVHECGHVLLEVLERHSLRATTATELTPFSVSFTDASGESVRDSFR